MTLDFSDLKTASRLLIEADLKPMQGQHFQPTGFPDLGAATYQLPKRDKQDKRVEMLLVESAQSMANRLEMMLLDDTGENLRSEFAGLSYVDLRDEQGKLVSNSLLEAHRLNSPYLLTDGKTSEGQLFIDVLTSALDYREDVPFNRQNLARTLLRYDINSLLHGVFLEKIAGRLRLERSLSGFIEARDVLPVSTGGVKNDRVRASSDKEQNRDASEGYGNVPYHREYYTAAEIKAYFSLDLAQIRSYGLGEAVEELLILLALYKVQALLARGMRLRTDCDFDVSAQRATLRPGKQDWSLPELAALEQAIPEAIAAVAALDCFAEPAVTTLIYEPTKKEKKSKKGRGKSQQEQAATEES